MSNARRDGTGTWNYLATAASSRYLQTSGTHSWHIAPSGTAGNTISFTQAMTLDTGGNLLVGLTSGIGSARLAVGGSVLSSTNTLSTFSGAYGGFDWASRELRLFSGTPDATGSFITLYTGVSGSITERMRLTASGVLLVNDTNPRTGNRLLVNDVNGYLSYGAPSVGSGRMQYEGGPGNVFNIEVANTTGAIAFRLEGGSGIVERARIDSAGNLGLGVTPSAFGLGRVFEIGNVGNAVWGVQQADLRLLANTRYDGTNYRYTNTGSTAARYDVNNATLGGHAWYTAPSGTAGNAISFTQAMTLGANGNLLLGTTNDYARLTVSAADAARIALVAGATRAVRIGANTTAALIEGVDNTGVASYQPLYVGGSIVELQSGSTTRAVVKANGQVRFVPLSADPAGAENGDVYYNSSTNKLRVYAGGAWVDLH
jgi:hypothetical protein